MKSKEEGEGGLPGLKTCVKVLSASFYFLMYSCVRHAHYVWGAHACMWVCACVCEGPRLENYPHLLF